MEMPKIISLRKIQKPKQLKPAEKFVLYGSLATFIASSGFKIAGDYNLESFNRDIKVDETITQCEQILGYKDKKIKVSKLDETGLLSYTFDKNELLHKFKDAREVYLKYQHYPCITSKDKYEKEKALDTILESNDKIIELFNEVTKMSLASKLHISPDQLEIYYNKPNEYTDPITTVKINSEEVAIGPELKELIKKYKDGLLDTYGKNLNTMPLSVKEETVHRILKNINDYRIVLNDLNDKNTSYIIYRTEPATDADYLVYDDPGLDETIKQAYNIKPLPKIEFLNIKIKKKHKDNQIITDTASNSSNHHEEQEER